MNIFKKKPVEKREKTKWEKVMEKFPVGKQFTYRTSHALTVVDVVPEIDCGECCWQSGELTCEYVDKMDRINRITFQQRQSDYLLALP